MLTKTYNRQIIEGVKDMMKAMPVTFISGPRQCGKTTLLNIMAAQSPEQNWVLVSLDDRPDFEKAQNDPLSFVQLLRRRSANAESAPPGEHEPVIAIDEAQRAPELFRAIKIDVHEHQGPGRYVLTGSANPNYLSKITESLAGRMGIVEMYPLSECELLGRESTFLSKIFAGNIPHASATNIREHLLHRLVTGGYPNVQSKPTWPERFKWQKSYIDQIILRDIGEMEEIRKLEKMSLLVDAAMAQTSCLENDTSLANEAELSPKTAMKYLYLFQAWGLLKLVRTWSNNVISGLRKKKKVHFLDTGLVCSRLLVDHENLDSDVKLFGRLTESMVFSELLKQASFLSDKPSVRFSHYRDSKGREIDLILETPRGDCYAIEVKSGKNFGSKDISNMKWFKHLVGEKFRMGIILYDGEHTASFGDGLYTAPIASLWE